MSLELPNLKETISNESCNDFGAHYNYISEDMILSMQIPVILADKKTRSGDSKRKQADYCNVSGVFGSDSVCNHGFIFDLMNI